MGCDYEPGLTYDVVVTRVFLEQQAARIAALEAALRELRGEVTWGEVVLGDRAWEALQRADALLGEAER